MSTTAGFEPHTMFEELESSCPAFLSSRYCVSHKINYFFSILLFFIAFSPCIVTANLNSTFANKTYTGDGYKSNNCSKIVNKISKVICEGLLRKKPELYHVHYFEKDEVIEGSKLKNFNIYVLPKGVVTLDKTINIAHRKNVVLIGDGGENDSLSRIRLDSRANTMFLFDDCVNCTLANIEIDPTFKHDDETADSNKAIGVKGDQSEITLSHIKIPYFSLNGYIHAMQAKSISLSHIKLADETDTPASTVSYLDDNAITLENCAQVKITDIKIININATSITKAGNDDCLIKLINPGRFEITNMEVELQQFPPNAHPVALQALWNGPKNQRRRLF